MVIVIILLNSRTSFFIIESADVSKTLNSVCSVRFAQRNRGLDGKTKRVDDVVSSYGFI
jgi:hypothetical protein